MTTLITLDLDDTTGVMAAYQAFRLNRMGGFDVRVRESAGGSGYHIEGYLDQDIDPQDEFLIRFLLGDCIDRLTKEYTYRSHGLMTRQFLADEKNGSPAGSWIPIEEVMVR